MKSAAIVFLLIVLLHGEEYKVIHELSSKRNHIHGTDYDLIETIYLVESDNGKNIKKYFYVMNKEEPLKEVDLKEVLLDYYEYIRVAYSNDRKISGKPVTYYTQQHLKGVYELIDLMHNNQDASTNDFVQLSQNYPEISKYLLSRYYPACGYEYLQ